MSTARGYISSNTDARTMTPPPPGPGPGTQTFPPVNVAPGQRPPSLAPPTLSSGGGQTPPRPDMPGHIIPAHDLAPAVLESRRPRWYWEVPQQDGYIVAGWARTKLGARWAASRHARIVPTRSA